jgi:UDP-N-acetylmuramoyl-tripeptide--D-alanyl-D-alanine ligase
MKIRISELAAAIGARLVGEDTVIESVSTNSREMGVNTLFVPLKGERFDAHDFIDGAVEGGAVAVVSQRECSINVPVLYVDDTHKALGDIARYYRESMPVKVVGITGSVGKTTTKDMIANVLSQRYNTLKTEGNFNNDIGVPLTLFRLEEDNEVAVIEMGMNHFDEIKYLAGIAKPDIGVITNVGVSHIENLGSREGILKAKCELLDELGDGLKVLNGDDDMLITIKSSYSNISYHTADSSDGDIYAQDIEPHGIDGIGCTIVCGELRLRVNIPVPGKHMVANALAAARVAMELGLSAEEIKSGIESFKPTAMRMDVIRGERYTVLNDVYNANPVSTMAGIEVLSYAEGTRCCILGDMLELGKYADKLHAEVGEYAVSKGIEHIVCIGSLSRSMYEAAAAKRSEGVYYFADKQSFISKADEILEDKMTLLVKASRGMHFEEIINYLKGE